MSDRRPSPSEANADVYEFPTPHDHSKLDIEQRLEVNAHSLRLLCKDLTKFIERLEKWSAKDLENRDDGEKDLIDAYLTRLSVLLSCIYNDIIGSEYAPPKEGPRLRQAGANQEMLHNLRESLVIINEVFQTVNKVNIVPTRVHYQELGTKQVHELFPFDLSVEFIEERVRAVERQF